MDIKQMRLIDEIAGIPICAGLSLLARRFQTDAKEFHSSNSPKILIIHLSEMGAFVLAQPALRELRRRLPNAQLYFMVFSPIDSLIKELQLASDSNIFVIQKDKMRNLTLSTMRAIYKLNRIKLDAVINEEGFSRFAAILSFLSCPKGLRVGLYPYGMRGLYKGDLETHRVQYNDHIHASRSYLNLINALWSDPHDEPMVKATIMANESLDVTPAKGTIPTVWRNYIPLSCDFNYIPKAEDLSTIDLALSERGVKEDRELIIVNPNSSDMLPHRRWALDNYVELCSEILKRHPQVSILVTGMAQEAEGARYLQEHIQGNIVDFTGATTVGQLLALYTRCRLMITNDSGPAHFASIVDLPTIVLYGPETPLLFSPLGNKCRQIYANIACSPCVSPYNNKDTSCRRRSHCVSCIKPSEVLEVFEKVWEQESANNER